MRTGLMVLAAAATLGTAAIGAAPVSAQYHHDGFSRHRDDGNWRPARWRHDRWERQQAWRRAHWREERERRWYWEHHHHHGYHGYHGRGYYR